MTQHNFTTALEPRTETTPNAPTRGSCRGIVTVALLLGLIAGTLSGCYYPVPGYCGPGYGYGPPARPYYRY